jgi:uncharacterized protein
MKIAVIGSGISGLTSAFLLSKEHEVHVFEGASYIGGHTHTVSVNVDSGRYDIDTGFIVFNDWTYPNFIKLMGLIGVSFKDTSMSFSVKVEQTGLEYNGTDLNGLFAQRKNILSLSFHRMIQDILRFNKESLEVLEDQTFRSYTLGKYLRLREFGDSFKANYIVPMGAAIWSASSKQMEEFPIQYFVQFFKNHGMLSVNERPIWKVIQGGSSSYIAPLTKNFSDRIHLNSPVRSVLRRNDKVSVSIDGPNGLVSSDFDHVVFSTHSDQTAKILQDMSSEERGIIGAFSYQPNKTVLHTDASVLPKSKRAWAAWNYWVPLQASDSVAVSYNMNILQGIRSPETFCVSLNMDQSIDESKVLARFTYDHPVYTADAVNAQKRWHEISGKNRTHYCGAYWGFGFHEDGVKSALNVGQSFGLGL